ncbi:MAG: NAD(P)/FAD-dependent oxidoreductase [Rhodoferax sp.]
METVQTVVVGAGVVGLAVARALARSGREVWVLEREGAVGTQTSARSSEVLHAGLYYPSASLKARLCVRGQALLYAYCAERGVAHRRCGKLVVAVDAAQETALHGLAAQACANGVQGLQHLDAAQARALEPELRCHSALWSPDTGLVDSHGLMMALWGDAQAEQAQVVFHTAVRSLQPASLGWELLLADGTRLCAREVVNAAGHGACALARHTQGLASSFQPQARYAKGHYFSLVGRTPFAHLIYPMPEPGGLGVHLTLDLQGRARFGPDVQWVESDQDFTVPPERADHFYGAIRRYWPSLPDAALQPAYAGVRPKIHGPGQEADFALHGPAQHGLQGLVQLLGIESPGLTSALALAEEVLAALDGCLG